MAEKIYSKTERVAATVDAMNTDVFRKIEKRLRTDFLPPIELQEYIDFDFSFKQANGGSVYVGSSTLDGVNFNPKYSVRLKQALQDAQTFAGERAFANLDSDPGHWALAASFGVTPGTGYREITRLKLSAPQLVVPKNYHEESSRLSGHFTDSFHLPDISSVHAAVSRDFCNFHIDETGFVMETTSGGIVVTPDSGYHFVNDLLYKTYLKKIMPNWFIDHTNLVLPNSSNHYDLRVGLNFEYQVAPKARFNVTGTCGSARSCHNWSITAGLSGSF